MSILFPGAFTLHQAPLRSFLLRMPPKNRATLQSAMPGTASLAVVGAAP
ncbi:hypothetical protein [Nitrobacter hamburgensis]|nr:hypothetical protein [Nitrobacter hamburgensis]